MAASGYREISLTPLPRKPIGPAVAGAWQYLMGAHNSVTGLFDALATVRSSHTAEARGRLASDETDLLRAAIVFTSSGVDASCKRLLRDTLATLIDGDPQGPAARRFEQFIDRELKNDRPTAPLAKAVKSRNPREELIGLYVGDVTRASMQGSADLRNRVRDALGISDTQLPADQLRDLDGFFMSRNAIVHDLDYERPGSPTSKRRNSRRLEDVRSQCDAVFAVVATVIAETARNIRAFEKEGCSQLRV
jgi:hypothetical protein